MCTPQWKKGNYLTHNVALRRAREIISGINLRQLKKHGIWRDPGNYAFVFGYPTKPMIMSQTISETDLRLMTEQVSGDASIYIHIPFCREICIFCPYTRIKYNAEQKRHYVRSLCTEIKLFSRKSRLQKVKCIYFGGGTPSMLEPEELITILGTVKECFSVDSVEEVTLEFHPSDVQNTGLIEVLADQREAKINRVSLGVQTFHDDTLRAMGCHHDSESAREAVATLCKVGLPLNVDLIIGYPTINGVDALYRIAMTIDALEEMHYREGIMVPSITVYYLWTRGETILTRLINKGRFKLPNARDGLFSRVYAMTRLHEMGYCDDASGWYVRDVSYSFRLQNSRWGGDNYIGFGLGAYGYSNKYSYYNATDFEEYYSRLSQGRLPIACGRRLTTVETLRRGLALGIKTRDGVPVSIFKDNVPKEFRKEIENRILWLEYLGLVNQSTERVQLTQNGRLFDDEIAEQFYAEEILGTFGKRPVGHCHDNI